MAQQVTLKVEPRSDTGKGPNRRLRTEETVPGVFYTRTENIPVQIKEMPLRKAFSQVGQSQILAVQVGDGEAKPSLIKAIQFHPYKNRILHVDFYGVDLTKALRVSVPVIVSGKSKGEAEGGVLELIRDHLEVECLPGDIPDKLTVDVTPLAIGQSIHVADVPMPAGVKAVYDDNYAVVGVIAKVAESEAGEGSGEAAA
ncbi:MAG: 50S ribosomal protein L25 [Thermodesulfobacteriota bacterium]